MRKINGPFLRILRHLYFICAIFQNMTFDTNRHFAYRALLLSHFYMLHNLLCKKSDAIGSLPFRSAPLPLLRKTAKKNISPFYSPSKSHLLRHLRRREDFVIIRENSTRVYFHFSSQCSVAILFFLFMFTFNVNAAR